MLAIFKGFINNKNRQGNNAECVKYLDGTLYNLKHKVVEVSLIGQNENYDRTTEKKMKQKLTIGNNIMKLRLQSKFYLQICAMLSQIDE